MDAQVSRSRDRPTWVLAWAMLLVLASLLVRVESCSQVVTEDGIQLSEPDTLRRVLRLERLADPTVDYPSANPWDGYPDGSVIHWTLPMDAVVWALDEVAAPFYPRARRFEVGALLAGPVVAAISTLLFYLGQKR